MVEEGAPKCLMRFWESGMFSREMWGTDKFIWQGVTQIIFVLWKDYPGCDREAGVERNKSETGR